VVSSTNTFICSGCHVTERRLVFIKDGREAEGPPMPMQPVPRIKRASTVQEEHVAAPGLLSRVVALLNDIGLGPHELGRNLGHALIAALGPMRSLRPSAQRYSIATVRPSVQPSSRSRCATAATHCPAAAAVPAPRNPTVGFLLGCARAMSGHAAAAPLSSVMNSRLLTRSPRRRGRAAGAEW
jgi:hypothetical protein